MNLLRKALDAWRFKKALWAIEREASNRVLIIQCPRCLQVLHVLPCDRCGFNGHEAPSVRAS